MTDYTIKVLDDAIHRIADKYGFDPEEAKTFLAGGGIVVKYPPLDREKLPWTGNVRAECCKAIKKNGGLFTQCSGIVHTDDWCKPCGKEVAKKGKPTCGTVADRAAVDVLEYQVGPFKVKPYAEFMKKQGIVREQVDKACDDYGITIDPRQFEVKKRPRKPRDMASAVDADAPSFEAFAEEVSRLVPAGNVYINRSIIGAVVGVQPFGGEGLSGTGPKAGGPNSLIRYAAEKAISVNIAAQGGDPALLNL
jgi:hypothetical protein